MSDEPKQTPGAAYSLKEAKRAMARAEDRIDRILTGNEPDEHWAVRDAIMELTNAVNMMACAAASLASGAERRAEEKPK